MKSFFKHIFIFFLVAISTLFYSTKVNAWVGTGVATLKSTQTTNSTNVNQTTPYAMDWSSSEFDSTFFTHDPAGANPERLIVDQTGDYLVSFTLPMVTGDTAQREQVEAEIYVNGSAYAGSIGGASYLRNLTNHTEASDHVSVLLTGLSVNDYIEVFVRLTGIAGIVNVDGTASLYVEYISPSRTVFSATATRTTNSTNLNQATAYDLQWSEDRKNTGFTHSDVTASENITLDGSGYYAVYVNMPYYDSNARDRMSVRLITQLDGVTVNGGHAKQGYLRDQSSYNNNASAHWSGVVIAPSNNQVLTVQTQLEAQSGTTTVPTGKVGSIFVEKLDDTTTGMLFVRGNDLTTGTDWDVSPAGYVKWAQSDFKDTNFYTHSTVSNSHQITVKEAGDYLLSYNDSMTSTTSRAANKITVEVNNTPISGAETKSHYIRNNSGHNESSGSLVFLLEDLMPNDVITIGSESEAANATVNDDQDALLFLKYIGRTEAYTGQLHYRWRDDTTDLNTSGGFLATEDTTFDAGVRNSTYRLRLGIANVGDTAEASAKTYELQYGVKSTTCSDISTWTGVADSADAIDMVATSHITPDGEATTSALLSNNEGYTRVNGEGRETADTTGSLGPLSSRTYTELEYSITPTNSAPYGTSYCFRAYDTTAAAPLDNYTNYAEFTVNSPYIEQLHYRWRDDSTDLNTTGGWIASEDSNPSTEIKVGDTYRLRLNVANTGGIAEESSHTYELKYGKQETTCAAITTWTGLSDASDDFDLVDTTYISPDGESTTGGLLANSETYTYVAGEGRDIADTTGSLGPLTNSYYTELEYSLQSTATAAPGTTYCFKLTKDTGNDLAAYNVYPTLSTEGGFKVQKILGSITGTLSKTESIPSPIASLENAFLMFDFSGASSADNIPSEGTCTAYISAVDTITVEKSATSGTCEYAIYVVEAMKNEFIVRGRGSISLAGADLSSTGTANNLSDIIDSRQVFIPGMSRSNGNGTNEWCETYTTLELTNPTTVTATRGNNTGTDTSVVARFEVVEFLASGVTVQTGETFLNDLGTADQDTTLNTAVTTSRAFVYNTFRHVHDGLAQTSVRSWLPSGTTLRFDRGATGAYDSYARWWVIEFPSGGATVQRGQSSQGGTNDVINATITTPVNMSRSFPVVTQSNSGAGNAFPRGRYYSDINSTTNLQMTSGYSGNTEYYAWEVIDTSGFVADPYTFVQNDFEFMQTAGSTTLTNNWPPGNGEDLIENEAMTQFPASIEPLDLSDQTRMQMNMTILGDTLPSATLGFKLQYTAADDCTTATTWTDVGAKGSGEIWRLFDESALANSTSQVNNISTSTAGAEGYYSEINPTSNNPNQVAPNENSEWDWPIENNGATPNTSYCFRMILGGSNLTFGSYRSDSYPKLTTAPGTDNLMRHGKFFSNDTLKGYFWAN